MTAANALSKFVGCLNLFDCLKMLKMLKDLIFLKILGRFAR